MDADLLLARERMFYQLLYKLALKSRRRRALRAIHAGEAIQSPGFQTDVETMPESVVSAHVRAPLSIRALIRLHQLKERLVWNDDLASDQLPDLAAKSSSIKPFDHRAIVRGMPAEVRGLFRDARGVEVDERHRDRVPFIHPLIIELLDDRRRISAVTRDISAFGIGFFHGTYVKPQMVRIEARCSTDTLVHLNMELLWCAAWGAGWHISGGMFR